MNKLNSLLILCSISYGLITSSTYSKNQFSNIIDNMIDDLKNMEQIIEKKEKEASGMLSSFFDKSDIQSKGSNDNIHFSIDQSDKNELKIICNGITDDTIKATSVTKKLFCIETTTIEILIKSKNNYISISAEQEEKGGVDKDKQKLSRYSCSRLKIKQHVPSKLNLENTTLNYNKDEKLLTITIPYQNEQPQK